ncbi:hypothetical protein ABPG72_021701 [Tetrahymena utriculariae]
MVMYPVAKLMKYKIQGVSIIKYYPLSGLWGILQKDFKKYGDSLRFFKQIGIQYPDAKSLAINIGGNIALYLIDPEMIKEFYSLNCYQKSPFIVKMFSRVLGNGFLFDEVCHNRKRNIFSKLFHFDNLKQVVPKIEQISQNWVTQKCDLGGNAAFKIDMIDLSQHISGDIITQKFFGINMNKYNYKGKTIPQNLYRLNTATCNQMRTLRYLLTGTYTFDRGWFKFDKEVNEDIKNIKQILINALYQRINQSSQQQYQSQSQKDFQVDMENSMIDQIIKDSCILDKKFSEMNQKEKEELNKSNKILPEELLEEYLTFYLAGMETTGHTVGFCFYFYCKYPKIREKLRNEISKHISPDQPITYENISQLNYLDCFIKEVFRIYGPTSTLMYRIATQDHKIKNIEIKKGSMVNLAILTNFYNSKTFKNPEEFNPDRWLVKNQINSYAYLPFSAGRRNCIGQHLGLLTIKIVFSVILRDFEVTLTNPDYKIDRLQKFVHGPSSPIYCNFERLKQQI